MWCQQCRLRLAEYWDRLRDRAVCRNCVNVADPMELWWLDVLDPATERRLKNAEDDIMHGPDYWFGDDRW
jgi:hypothetical protein